jgi:hypothetical protein
VVSGLQDARGIYWGKRRKLSRYQWNLANNYILEQAKPGTS